MDEGKIFKMNVKLISLTQPQMSTADRAPMNAEDIIAYCARVSNPKNQNNTKTAPKLLKFLIKHKHWSPFELANMCVEIKTSRGIAAQILRHRSFSFQEFSQRYSEATTFEDTKLRRQAEKNRQSSEEEINPTLTDDYKNIPANVAVRDYLWKGKKLYDDVFSVHGCAVCRTHLRLSK